MHTLQLPGRTSSDSSRSRKFKNEGGKETTPDDDVPTPALDMLGAQTIPARVSAPLAVDGPLALDAVMPLNNLLLFVMGSLTPEATLRPALLTPYVQGHASPNAADATMGESRPQCRVPANELYQSGYASPDASLAAGFASPAAGHARPGAASYLRYRIFTSLM
ncbi:hypothetical protein C8R44DRAFT_881043 [Mycena epipterygia]|nr:hypothetical protein C8R44DRAFT_881043 [Mycena epipterygia]